MTAALTLLTAVTGVVEAVSFLGLGMVFTAVMTGNTLFIGFALVGAYAGNRAYDALRVRSGERWLPLALYGEGALLAVTALLALGLPEEGAHLSPHRFTVITLVSAIMGARNVTILRAGARSRDLPTTVVTRALAGLFLTAPPETRARRLATVVATFAGAALGALLLRLHPSVPLLVAAAAVAGAGVLCAREITGGPS